MNVTETPAFRLTKNSILSSLKATGKTHLVLTGSRGAGKSTLFSQLSKDLPGIRTFAVPKEKVCLRFSGEDKEYTIGTYEEAKSVGEMPTNRMKANVEILDFLAERIRKESENAPVFSIDEIGYLEEASEAFSTAILELFDRCQVTAVLRKQETKLFHAIRERNDVLLVDLDDPFGRCGAVIMASGEGKRFGENKLMADLMGRPLVDHVMGKAEALGIGSVVVTRHKEVQVFCKGKGQEVILHDLPGRNDTTRLGTEFFMQRGMDFVLFFQGDQPFVGIDSLMAMLITAKADPEKIVRLSFEGNDCSPVLFPKACFEDLRTLPDGKGGGAIIRRHPEKVLRVDAQAEWETWDIDTREDLAKCQAL